EFQQVRVTAGSAANPDVALEIDGETVLLIKPLVTGTTGITAPVSQQISRLIEFEHCRRGTAAHRPWRIHLQLLEVVGERARSAVQPPDVILIVDADPAQAAEHPMIGQRFRPERIDFEPRRLNSGGGLLRGDLSIAGTSDDPEHNDEQSEANPD